MVAARGLGRRADVAGRTGAAPLVVETRRLGEMRRHELCAVGRVRAPGVVCRVEVGLGVKRSSLRRYPGFELGGDRGGLEAPTLW